MFSLTDIDAGYGRTPVLRTLTIDVPSGSVVAVLGPNGAGKTTMLRVASGLLRPWAGTLTLDGSDLTGGQPAGLTAGGVCHIPEGRGVFPTLTVEENLSIQLQGRPKERLQLAFEAFPILGQRRNQAAGTLSGGEQQMLALSRAYLTDPKVILVDEVSLGLAPKIVDEIFGFLQGLRARGSSLVIVEQYVSKALALADYVYVLNRGQVTFAGEPSELADGDMAEQYFGVEVQAARR